MEFKILCNNGVFIQNTIVKRDVILHLHSADAHAISWLMWRHNSNNCLNISDHFSEL